MYDSAQRDSIQYHIIVANDGMSDAVAQILDPINAIHNTVVTYSCWNMVWSGFSPMYVSSTRDLVLSRARGYYVSGP